MIVKALTKALTDNGVGRRDRPGLGHSCAVRLSCGRHQGGRRYRYALLALICGLLLAGCVMPEAVPTQSSSDNQVGQGEQGAKVEAIQTRVAEERAEQASNKEDTMAEASDGAQGQAATVEESGEALSPGPTAAQQELLAKLRPQGEAPELLNEVWLNSEPLKLADLRGNVVLVEFWTYGWYNCVNVIPSLREWHEKYKDDGFVIIGVHTPEFRHERDVKNVENSLLRLNIDFAVAIDNDWKTWRSYNNRYWPAMYFIDKTGQIRYLKIGEGQYAYSESVIQALLAEQYTAN